jgi:multidrug resistance efflux pump
LQLDKTTVRAPITGIVAQISIAAGAMAAPAAPVARLISPEVQIVIPVDIAGLAQIHTGQTAVIQVDAYPGETFSGVVAVVAPAADPATQSVPVTIRPTDDDARLIPGMLATVRLAAD